MMMTSRLEKQRYPEVCFPPVRRRGGGGGGVERNLTNGEECPALGENLDMFTVIPCSLWYYFLLYLAGRSANFILRVMTPSVACLYVLLC